MKKMLIKLSIVIVFANSLSGCFFTRGTAGGSTIAHDLHEKELLNTAHANLTGYLISTGWRLVESSMDEKTDTNCYEGSFKTLTNLSVRIVYLRPYKQPYELTVRVDAHRRISDKEGIVDWDNLLKTLRDLRDISEVNGANQ